MKLSYIALVSALLLSSGQEGLCKERKDTVFNTLKQFAEDGWFPVIKSDQKSVDIKVSQIYELIKHHHEARELLHEKKGITYFAPIDGSFDLKTASTHLHESLKYQTAQGLHNGEVKGSYEILKTYLKGGDKSVDLPIGMHQRSVLDHFYDSKLTVGYGSPHGSAEVYGFPVDCTNGVIYFVDRFFTPPKAFEYVLNELGMGEYVVEYAKTGLPYRAGGFTYFVPELSNDNIKILAANVNMTSFFLNHNVEGVLYSDEITTSRKLKTLGNIELDIQITDPETLSFTVNGQAVTKYDFPVSNGVAYFVKGPIDSASNGQGGSSTPVQFNNTASNGGSGSSSSGSGSGASDSKNKSNVNATKNGTSSDSSVFSSTSTLMTALVSASISAGLFFFIGA